MKPFWIFAVVVGCGGSQPSPAVPSVGAPTASPASGIASAESVPHLAAVDVPTAIRAVIDAPERTDNDRKLDSGRRPDALLAFAGIAPGMRVADLGAGMGYTTEL